MYTRNFGNGEDEGIMIPEKYSGIAFGESREGGIEEEKLQKSESVMCEKDAVKKESLLHGFGKYFPKGIFDSLPFFKGGFKLGTEEILIIAVAAFLFFSKDGDKECALILLMLLFIS